MFDELIDTDNRLAQGTIGIVAVPRGGIPTGNGLTSAFNKAGMGNMLKRQDSEIKANPDKLYKKGLFSSVNTLVIADGIIGTGKTICDHLKQVPKDWNGMITVFANAASKMGIESVGEYAKKHIQQKVGGVTGRVFSDDECDWVDCGGKNVYFIGYNEDKKIDYKLPDFGDHINLKR